MIDPIIGDFIDGLLWTFSVSVFSVGVTWKLAVIIFSKRQTDLSVARDSALAGAVKTVK